MEKFYSQFSMHKKIPFQVLTATCYILSLSVNGGCGTTQKQVIEAATGQIEVDVNETINRLVTEEDLDDDKKITVIDYKMTRGIRGDRSFQLVGIDGTRHLVTGTYPLSNLLQELVLARERGSKKTTIDLSVVYENPVDRISRLIREMYWDGLTRRVDREYIPRIIQDSKQVSIDSQPYIYVPAHDQKAFDYFSELSTDFPQYRLKVIRLPKTITAEYVRSLDGRHGILSLALTREKDGGIRGVPFVVPGGRFNEMYGWDSYFEALGLLVDGRVDLAKAMVDNFVYQIENYGKILNANRSYYLTRSQPPFLTSMALAVYEVLPKSEESKSWLKQVFQKAIIEYEQVWTERDRLVADTGLSRYYGEGTGPCPEVEPGHYDEILKPYADNASVDPLTFLKGYLSGVYKVPELDQFFSHDRAVRESGHDTTRRFDDRTADFLPVDLNSLLYKIEIDIARTIDEVFNGDLVFGKDRIESSRIWYERARSRRIRMNRYMWDAQQGLFFDYDTKNKRHSQYVSATTFYPLWAGVADKDQAASLITYALPLLEMPGGVAASTERSRGPVNETNPQRQWDFPSGWPPHQMLIWEGLRKYGYSEAANRLTYLWLYMITTNAVKYSGTIPEKFDVVCRTHKVFAEYGNVGTDFSYITTEGFGWMNASYQVGLKSLPKQLLSKLKRLEPPENIFTNSVLIDPRLCDKT